MSCSVAINSIVQFWNCAKLHPCLSQYLQNTCIGIFIYFATKQLF
jgi:hypothetical protein